MKKSLDIYKEIKAQRDDVWRVAVKMSMYASVNAFIDNPTDDEYETIANACYEAYMKTSDVDFIKLCDRVSEEYSSENLTLSEIKEMSSFDLLYKFAF